MTCMTNYVESLGTFLYAVSLQRYVTSPSVLENYLLFTHPCSKYFLSSVCCTIAVHVE